MSHSTKTTEPTPFFEDTRSVSERLNAEQCSWKPTKGEGPQMLAGLMLDRGTYISDLDGSQFPTAVLLDEPTADGVEWNVIGFHGWLRAFLLRENPRIGDWVAVAFTGTKPSKKAGESDAYMYRGVVERNPAGPQPASAKDTLLEDGAEERERVLAQSETATGASVEAGPMEGDDWGGFGGEGDDDIPL